MPSINKYEVVLTSHWLVRTTGYPVLEGRYWTKCSGFSQKTETLSYRSPFFNQTFQIPSGNRTYQPLVVSGEMYYGSDIQLVKAWRAYENQPITIISQAEDCSTVDRRKPKTILPNVEKTVKYTGCIWIGLDCYNADRSQQTPTLATLTFTYVNADDGTRII